jgi:hypothetical protein
MLSDDTKRANYSEGQYLRAQDFLDEQRYHRDQRRRLSLAQHTWGIFSGLDLVEQPREGSQDEVDVFVSTGMAVDGFGREIVVFFPFKLDPAQFKQPQFNTDGWVQVWIRFGTELTDPPRYGYELCDDPALAYRTHEIFCIEIGPMTPDHDPVVVAAQQVKDVDLPPDRSVPAQALPDDAERARWLVPLGYVHWNGLDAFLKSKTPQDDQQRVAGRRYGGVVAGEVVAHGRLRIAERHTPTPLPAPPVAGVDVTLEGRLTVDRTLAVGTPTHRRPLTIRAAGTDHNLVGFETPAGAPSWHLNASPGGTAGLNVAETGVVGSPSRLFIRSGGNVGVGTTTPRNPLAVRAEGTSEELVSFEDPGGATRWHLNQRLGGTKPGFNLAETGVADGRLFVKAGGDVGIATTDPVARLHVAGGDVRWGNDSRLTVDQGGSIELGGSATAAGIGTPYVDFHFSGLSEDFNARIINDANGQLSLVAPVVRATGAVTAAGNLGSTGLPSAPATPGWTGGVHTRDVEAEGRVWSALGYELGTGTARTRVPVDVMVGEILLNLTAATTGVRAVTLTSRLPSVSDATIAVALSEIGNQFVANDAYWAVWLFSKQPVSQNSFQFNIFYRLDDSDGKLIAFSYIAVFIP